MDGVNVNITEEQITLLDCAQPANDDQIYYFQFLNSVIPISLELYVIQKYQCIRTEYPFVSRAAHPRCSEL